MKIRNRLLKFRYEEYTNIKNAYKKVLSNLDYFPVAASTNQKRKWITYVNSWGFERTYGGQRAHEGTDVMAGENIKGLYPIISISDGVVTNKGWLEKGGYRLGITAANGAYFYYAHMDSYANDIEVGSVVKKGQFLGFMGNTGYSKVEGTKDKFDFVITEIGGTVGDIESLPFIESVRQLRWELGKNCICVHLTYVPYISAAKEVKTKPTQHSVKQLQEQGIQPDVLVLRTENELSREICKKVALFCNVEEKAVIQSYDVPTIYEVPLVLAKQEMEEIILRKMGMDVGEKPELKLWKEFLDKKHTATKTVKIALVGKYVELPDAYKSINESLLQAATYHHRKLDIQFIQSEKLTPDNVKETLSGADAVLIAPGFGQRGIEGKFTAIRYARENNMPTLGICLGMQCMVIEYARNVLGLQEANSTEMDVKTTAKVIDLMEEQKGVTNMGGSMRLGAYDCEIVKKTKAHEIYKRDHIQERHRHRYEFNNEFKDQFEAAGMKCSGINPDTGLVEIVEIPDLKWFIGVQFHPEYNSTVVNPNPLFMSFIEAAIKKDK